MGNQRGTTPGSPARRSVSRRGSSAGNTSNQRVVSQASQEVHELEAAAQEQANRTQQKVIMADTSLFQLRCEREELRADGFRQQVPARTLKFVKGKAQRVTDEDVEIVEKIIAGTWADGRVTGPEWAKLARNAKLRIIHPGLVTIEMPTWDTLPSSQVVQVAMAAGYLSSPSDISRHLAYEQQSPLRPTNPREPRPEVVERLVALRQAVTGEAYVPTAESAAVEVASGVDALSEEERSQLLADLLAAGTPAPEQTPETQAPDPKLLDELVKGTALDPAASTEPVVDRAKLEARAAELEITYPPNIGDVKLAAKIDKAEAELKAAGKSQPTASSSSTDDKAAEATASAPGLKPTAEEN